MVGLYGEFALGVGLVGAKASYDFNVVLGLGCRPDYRLQIILLGQLVSVMELIVSMCMVHGVFDLTGRLIWKHRVRVLGLVGMAGVAMANACGLLFVDAIAVVNGLMIMVLLVLPRKWMHMKLLAWTLLSRTVIRLGFGSDYLVELIYAWTGDRIVV